VTGAKRWSRNRVLLAVLPDRISRKADHPGTVTGFHSKKDFEMNLFTTMVTGKGQVWLERKYRAEEPEGKAA
jgi:hypothetical protein